MLQLGFFVCICRFGVYGLTQCQMQMQC